MTRLDLIRAYKDIKTIIDYMIEIKDIKFITSPLAPNTFKGMKAYFNDHGQFLVFNGGDHGMLGQEHNIKFRALHDYMHLANNLTFKFEDEKKLSDITVREFSSFAKNFLGLPSDRVFHIEKVIDREIRGQIEYYEANGDYIPCQKTFIVSQLLGA